MTQPPNIPRKVRVDADVDAEVMEYLEAAARKYGVPLLAVAEGCLRAGLAIDREEGRTSCEILPFRRPPEWGPGVPPQGRPV